MMEAEQVPQQEVAVENGYGQEYVTPFDYYGGSKQQEDGISHFNLKTEKLIVDLRDQLRGVYWDKREKRYIQYRKAKLNEEGIQDILLVLRPVLDKNLILSHLTETMIYKITYDVSVGVADLLRMNYYKYECQKSDLTLIVNLVKMNTLVTLRRAIGGLALKSQTSSHQVHEQVMVGNRQKQYAGNEGGGQGFSFFNKTR